MPAYRWLDDDSLGNVLEREELGVYEPEFIGELFDALAESDTAVFGRRPTYRAFLDRFRYVTQDKGALTDATGLYAWPVGEGPFPLILWTHGTSGYSDACAPSAAALDNPLAPDALIAGALASFGYVVVAADYLGMKSFGDAPSAAPHPYLVGEPTAIASLDAARAAYALARDDGTALGQLFVAGASQGGHAAGLTVRYQPHYANELEPVAALYLIPPLNLLGHVRRVLEGTPDPTTMGNMGTVLMGHASWFGVAGGLAGILQPQWASYVEQETAAGCAIPPIEAPLEDVLTPAALEATRAGGEDFALPPWDCMLRESSLVQTSVPRLDRLPALVVTGERDTLVDADIEREGSRKLCDAGMRIEFVECDGQDHLGAVEASLDQLFDFLDARRAGAAAPEACIERPVQICASDPRAAAVP